MAALQLSALGLATLESWQRWLVAAMQQAAAQRADDGRESIGCRIAAGAMAGCTAWSSIYPVDVLRSRIMSSGGAPVGAPVVLAHGTASADAVFPRVLVGLGLKRLRVHWIHLEVRATQPPRPLVEW